MIWFLLCCVFLGCTRGVQTFNAFREADNRECEPGLACALNISELPKTRQAHLQCIDNSSTTDILARLFTGKSSRLLVNEHVPLSVAHYK